MASGLKDAPRTPSRWNSTGSRHLGAAMRRRGIPDSGEPPLPSEPKGLPTTPADRRELAAQQRRALEAWEREFIDQASWLESHGNAHLIPWAVLPAPETITVWGNGHGSDLDLLCRRLNRLSPEGAVALKAATDESILIDSIVKQQVALRDQTLQLATRTRQRATAQAASGLSASPILSGSQMEDLPGEISGTMSQSGHDFASPASEPQGSVKPSADSDLSSSEEDEEDETLPDQVKIDFCRPKKQKVRRMVGSVIISLRRLTPANDPFGRLRGLSRSPSPILVHDVVVGTTPDTQSQSATARLVTYNPLFRTYATMLVEDFLSLDSYQDLDDLRAAAAQVYHEWWNAKHGAAQPRNVLGSPPQYSTDDEPQACHFQAVGIFAYISPEGLSEQEFLAQCHT